MVVVDPVDHLIRSADSSLIHCPWKLVEVERVWVRCLCSLPDPGSARERFQRSLDEMILQLTPRIGMFAL